MKTHRYISHYAAYSVSMLGINRKTHTEILGCVFSSSSLEVIKRKIYQYVCGSAGCGVVVRSVKRTSSGFVTVCKFVPSWDTRALNKASWETLAA